MTAALREKVEELVAQYFERSDDVKAVSFTVVEVIEHRQELRKKWEAQEAKPQ